MTLALQIPGVLVTASGVFIAGWVARQAWEIERDVKRSPEMQPAVGPEGVPAEVLYVFRGCIRPWGVCVQHAQFVHKKFMSRAQAWEQVRGNSAWFGVPDEPKYTGWRKAHTANYYVWFDARLFEPGDPANRKKREPEPLDPGEPDPSLDVRF